jgi:hypothetical protein
MLTEKNHQLSTHSYELIAQYQKGQAVKHCVLSVDPLWWVEEGVNAAKRSTVSTGQLRPLLALHTRPINPVVFRESSFLRKGNLVLRGVSRLDAFSVYPGRT